MSHILFSLHNNTDVFNGAMSQHAPMFRLPLEITTATSAGSVQALTPLRATCSAWPPAFRKTLLLT